MEEFNVEDVVTVELAPVKIWVDVGPDHAVPATEATVMVFERAVDPNEDPSVRPESCLSIRSLLNAYNFMHGTDY